MCIKAVEEDPWQLMYVPDQYKMQAVRVYPWSLEDVPDHLKTQKMSNEAFEEER